MVNENALHNESVIAEEANAREKMKHFEYFKKKKIKKRKTNIERRKIKFQSIEFINYAAINKYQNEITLRLISSSI